jgi:uncharacterized protein (DUF952 family)
MNNLIYHLTSQSQWQEAQKIGEYKPKNFASEGFIHCSYLHQLISVADRFYRGSQDLVLIAIDPDCLSCQIIEENLEGGNELFPHIYGKLPKNSTKLVIPFPCNLDGSFSLPSELLI